jgi:hypothetical protein
MSDIEDDNEIGGSAVGKQDESLFSGRRCETIERLMLCVKPVHYVRVAVWELDRAALEVFSGGWLRDF